jgi:thiamine biosynthesis lipoprotein ApbE
MKFQEVLGKLEEKKTTSKAQSLALSAIVRGYATDILTKKSTKEEILKKVIAIGYTEPEIIKAFAYWGI